MPISPNQRRAQFADTRCQHAHPTSLIDSVARPRLIKHCFTPPNQPFLPMTSPIECTYSLLLHSSRRRPPSRTLSTSRPYTIPLDAVPRRACNAVSQLSLLDPANQAIPGSLPPRPRCPRILSTPFALAPPPPTASREDDSGPSCVQTQASRVGMDRRESAEPGRTRLPSPDSLSPWHPEADSLCSPPPPVSFSPRTSHEDIEMGSSSMQDG
ncbi:hypothetical protein DFH09DRAFT_1334417 [Mycena vulgaris]|nr:hypothetical protein DFH09DRAFT_1334417 [Mycena vulgaris]